MRSRDAIAAAVAAAIAFVGYLWTLHPGLAGGDSAEFQYIGRALAPAHSPGYPVYVGLLCVWSYLVPIGSLAFRANLLSAWSAAGAVGVTVQLARRLDAPWPLAVVCALGLAFGRVFWSQAIVAEVYSFGALILGALLAEMLRRDRERPAPRAVVVGAFLSLLLAHQPVVAFLVGPAIGVYVVLLRGRDAWKWLAVAGGVTLLGLLPYGFVLARSGSAARGASIVTASSFRDYFLPFTLVELLTRRTALVGGIVVRELGVIGVLACLVGLVWMAATRWKDVVLLLGIAAAVFAFGMSYGVRDVAVFTIPLFMVAWPLAGAGVAAAHRRLGRRARWVVVALAVTLPVWQYARAYERTDRSDDMRDERYFGALMRALPPNAAVAPIEFPLDQMLEYAVRAEGKRPDVRAIYPSSIEASVLSGRPTFILTNTAPPPPGLGVVDVPIFAESLEEFLERGKAGEIVVLCARGRDLDAAEWRRVQKVLGAESLVPTVDNVIVVGALGARRAVVRAATRAELALERGDVVGDRGARLPGRLSVVCDDGGVRIETAGRALRDTSWAGRAVLARIRPDGRAKSYDTDAALRVAASYRLFRVLPPHAVPPSD